MTKRKDTRIAGAMVLTGRHPWGLGLRNAVLAFALTFSSGCDDMLGNVKNNVPDASQFDRLMARDLQKAFCSQSVGSCRVHYELLRNGPTQSGTSWPKFYVWVERYESGALTASGATVLAAMDQVEFKVWRFMSHREISEYPDLVGKTFPAPLVNLIIDKARKGKAPTSDFHPRGPD